MKLGLTWEYLVGLFPTEELQEMERPREHEEYSIYIQIHAEPATEDPR